MCVTQDVVEYPEEGFAILKDSQGSYLAFRDSDHFESLDDGQGPMAWPKSWKAERKNAALTEFDLLFLEPEMMA